MPIQIYLNIAADMSRFLVEVSRKHPLKEQLENAVRSAGYEKTNVFFYDTDNGKGLENETVNASVKGRVNNLICFNYSLFSTDVS